MSWCDLNSATDGSLRSGQAIFRHRPRVLARVLDDVEDAALRLKREGAAA